MSDIIRNGFYVGLGLALKTRDMIEDFGKRFVEENRMNEEEGRTFMQRILRQSEETRDDLVNVVEERIRKILEEIGVASRADVADLAHRVENLESKATNQGGGKSK